MGAGTRCSRYSKPASCETRHHCHMDDQITSKKPEGCKYKTFSDVKTSVHYIYTKSKEQTPEV